MSDESVMQAFSELDWESVPEDPFDIPEGSYVCFVKSADFKVTRDGTKRGLAINYAIEQPEEFSGLNISEWKNFPQITDPRNITPDEQRALTWLKQRLRSLDIPNDRIATFTPADVIGLRVLVGVVKTQDRNDPDRQYTNVRRVEVVGEEYELEIKDPYLD